MFKCNRCHETHKGSPEHVPTGFRKNEGVVNYGARLGEAALCKKCALAFASHRHEIIEVQGGFRYTFL